MDLGIEGKRALVMASSRGLGLGCATALVAEGADVLLCGRSLDRLKENVDTLNTQGPGRAHCVACDLSEPTAVNTLVEAVESTFGAVDILINNTGGPPPGEVADAGIDTLRAQFDTMVATVIDLTQRLMPAMREAGWGRVVTIGSSGVEQPIPNLALSNILRASLVGWTKSLSNEVAGDGVTVNMLLPGRIHTERVDELDAANADRSGRDIEAVREAARNSIPAGRYGRVEEFGAVAAFLASAPASYINGSLVRCDGGAIASV